MCIYSYIPIAICVCVCIHRDKEAFFCKWLATQGQRGWH